MASLADHEADFTAYEKMPEDSNCWLSRKLDAIKTWVAMEKIHGANLSFTVSCGEEEVRVAKRGGYLKKGESFFGVCRQKGFLEREQEKARELFGAVVKRDSSVNTITVYGELFGGYYPHSLVPTSPGVIPVQTEVIYCPDLKFMAYDIAACHTSGRNYLDYDVCMKLFKDCGFFYAEPLIIGSLQCMLSYPLGFPTKIPAKFHLPPIDGKSNTAEGLVIKPLKTVQLEAKKGLKRVIFKRKLEGFMERKERAFSTHSDKTQYSKYESEFELLKRELYALITEQRVVNVVSKLGRPQSESEWEELVEGMVGDVLESISRDNETEWGACQRDPLLLEELMQELQEESLRAVEQYRAKL